MPRGLAGPKHKVDSSEVLDPANLRWMLGGVLLTKRKGLSGAAQIKGCRDESPCSLASSDPDSGCRSGTCSRPTGM